MTTGEALASAFLSDCDRLRSRWIDTLTPLLGREDAIMLIDVVETCVGGDRRWTFAGEIAFVESLGDAREVERLIVAKALRTCVLLLAASDERLDAVTRAVPRATYARLAEIAIKLRDHASGSAPTEHTKP